MSKIPQDGQHGRFCIDCWDRKPRAGKEPGTADEYEFFDDRREMNKRAKTLMRGGRFVVIRTFVWEGDWIELRSWRAPFGMKS